MHDFPQLEILAVEDVLSYEAAQNARSLGQHIRASGILRNPPIVAPLQDGTARCMVLEGANQVAALRKMGYPHALVQVVPPDHPGLGLQQWNHAVWELNAARFLKQVAHLPGLHLARLTEPGFAPRLEGDCGLAIVQTCRGRRYAVCTEAHTLQQRVEALNVLVDGYTGRARVAHTSLLDVALLRPIYPALSGLVIFPVFTISDLLRLAGQASLLPPGILRFAVAPRALHLNYPLPALAANEPLEAKNQALQKWIQERLAHKSVRYYAEPTYVFDE